MGIDDTPAVLRLQYPNGFEWDVCQRHAELEAGMTHPARVIRGYEDARRF